MMKSHFTNVFIIICFFCCIYVTSFPVPPRPDQIEILLDFKNEFATRKCDCKENFHNISSWTKYKDGDYYYLYNGVSFDEETGVVTELYLCGACICGTIQSNSSLFRFQHLRYLDLSINHFDSPIPPEFGRFTNLISLNLYKSGFTGEVPSSISNLTRLTKLDLSYNKLTGRFPSIQNLTQLSHLDLSYNHFSETIPSSLFTMPSLSHLDLRENNLRAPLEKMTSSTTSKLVYLDMAKNRLSCRILEPISKLAKLTYLDVSFQSTTYTTNFAFLPFKSLEYLDLSGNSISMLNTSSTTLKTLILSGCNISEFPTFLQTLQNLSVFDISKNKLKGEVPEWLWNLPSLWRVNISYNSINALEGPPKVLLKSSLSQLDLSANAFYGSFPVIPPTIQVMAASDNNFSGRIPLTVCNVSRLRLLDLSNNSFGGSVPRCLVNESLGVEVLKLQNNNLIGTLPDITNLVTLDVGHNQITGKLPRSLVNCSHLVFLNVESNKITDTFPFWLKALPALEVLVLRSNRFHGPISSPKYPLAFPALRIINIAHNKFSGSLPPNYFVNWSIPLVNVIMTQDYSLPWHSGYTGDWNALSLTPQWYYPSIYMRSKGVNTEFEKIQVTFTAIDFSGNRLEGQIPKSIGLLKSLIMLDLSNNNFTSPIPSSLANLTQLESLDLSRNQLSGKIPRELRDLTFLEYINMSHNKLNGQIPQSTQIMGQPKSSFEGNIDLCGLPLKESCFRGNDARSTPQTQQPEREQVLNFKAVVIGYAPGLLFGVAIAQALATYKPVLFFKLFRL